MPLATDAGLKRIVFVTAATGAAFEAFRAMDSRN